MALPLKRPQRAKFPKIAISAPRVLNSKSPILSQDVHGFLAAVLSLEYWSQYSEAEKRKLIDLFPPAYQSYDVDRDGKLECPYSADFLQSDAYVKASVARFKRDVEAGYWEAKWQEQARKAMQERMEGNFDEYLADHAEDCFGEDTGTPVAEDEGESRSDWEREHGRREAEEGYVMGKVVARMP